MEDILQGNLNYLYHNKHRLYELIQDYLNSGAERKCELYYDETSGVNLLYHHEDQVNLLYAHDGSDLNEWIQQYEELRYGQYDIVLYGLGLTHHLVRLIQLNPQLNFYIYEPDVAIFVESLKVLNMEDLFEHPQVKLLYVGNEDIHARAFHIMVNTYSEYHKVDVFIPFYAQLHLDNMREFYNYNFTIREAQLLEQGFESIFGTLPYRNIIRNIEKIYRSHSLRVLKNKFEDCTAIVIGGGPSLEIDIEQIKANRDKLLVIAAGSSIQSLLHFGLEPDLTVSMDPGEANGRVFYNIRNDVSNVPLVFVPQIYTHILNLEFHSLFHAYFSNDPIIDYLLSDIAKDTKVRATHSVTGTAIQVAHYLGAKRVLFAGQDLSFPGEKYYSSGAQHVNTGYSSQVVQSSALEVENVNGSINRTNISMRATLENIESLISDIQNVEFINTSSLGAKIKGADYKSFAEAIQLVENIYDFTEIKRIDAEEAKAINIELTDLLQRIDNFILTCDELVEYGNKSLKLVTKFEVDARKSETKAMNTLAKLENEFSKVTEHRLFSLIVPVWNRGLTKKYDQQVVKIEKEKNIIEKSKLLNAIVVPYIVAINDSFQDMKEEFKQLKEKLELCNTAKEGVEHE